jgi:hypothetical protein
MKSNDFTREYGPRVYDDMQARLKRGTVFRYNQNSFNTIHVNLLTHVEEEADPIHESEREDDMPHDEKTEEERQKLKEDEEKAEGQGSGAQDSNSASNSSSDQQVLQEPQEEMKEEFQAEPESGRVHVAQGGDQTHEPVKPEEVPPKTPAASPVQEQEQAEVTSSQESIITMETLSALAGTTHSTGNESQEETPQAENGPAVSGEVEPQVGNGTPTVLDSLTVDTKLPRARVYNAAAIDAAMKHMTEKEDTKTNIVQDDSPTTSQLVDYSEETPKTDETPMQHEEALPPSHTAEAEQILLDANMAQEMVRLPNAEPSQLAWSRVVAKVKEQKGEGSGKGEGSSKGSDNGTKPATSNSSVKSNTTKTNEAANPSRRTSQGG